MEKRFSNNHNAKYGGRYYKKEKIDKALPLKAAIITIVIMLFLYISIISLKQLTINVSAFISATFLTNLIVIFAITLIYDYITTHRKFLTQELYGTIFSSTAIGILVSSLGLVSWVNAVEAAVTIFVSLYVGYLVANRKKVLRVVQFFLVLFLIVILIEEISTNTLSMSLGTLSNTNSSLINNTKVQQLPASRVLGICEVNVKTQLNILDSQLPSGSQVSIINSTIFYNTGNSSTQNVTVYSINSQTINTVINAFTKRINGWIMIWASIPGGGGIPTKMNCYENYSYSDEYICMDMRTLGIETSKTNIPGIGAVGVVVRIQGNYGGSSESISYTNPILCDSEGNVMPNSLSWLKNIPSIE